MQTTKYNGAHAVTHKVQPGESLSKIAAAYGFKSWDPIWIYNSQVHRTVGPNPNLIRAGQQIFIPRSRKAYDDLLRKLRSLKAQMSGHVDQVKHRLEGQRNKHQATRVLFDLAGDVLTLVGTVGAKAAGAARQARMAAQTTGQAKVAAHYLAENAAKELSKDLKKELVNKGTGYALTLVDEDLGKAHKDLYVTQKKGIEAIRGVSTQPGKKLFQWETSTPKSFLDISEILLDYVQVSNVADGFLWLLTGETTGQTYEAAQKGMQDAVRSSHAMLDQKIMRITKECSLVYSKGG